MFPLPGQLLCVKKNRHDGLTTEFKFRLKNQFNEKMTFGNQSNVICVCYIHCVHHKPVQRRSGQLPGCTGSPVFAELVCCRLCSPALELCPGG